MQYHGCTHMNILCDTYHFNIIIVLDKPSIVLIVYLTFQMTSQVPYMEQFMGPPHVFTLDIGDTQSVEDTLTAAMSTIVRS